MHERDLVLRLGTCVPTEGGREGRGGVAPAPRRGRASSRSSAAYPSPLARSASLSIVRLPALAMSTLWNLCGPCASASVAVLL